MYLRGQTREGELEGANWQGGETIGGFQSHTYLSLLLIWRAFAKMRAPSSPMWFPLEKHTNTDTINQKTTIEKLAFSSGAKIS